MSISFKARRLKTEFQIKEQVLTDKIYSEEHILQQAVQNAKDLIFPVSRQSIWLLAYIAIITTWPFVGSVLLVLKRRFKTFVPATLFRKKVTFIA